MTKMIIAQMIFGILNYLNKKEVFQLKEDHYNLKILTPHKSMTNIRINIPS